MGRNLLDVRITALQAIMPIKAKMPRIATKPSSRPEDEQRPDNPDQASGTASGEGHPWCFLSGPLWAAGAGFAAGCADGRAVAAVGCGLAADFNCGFGAGTRAGAFEGCGVAVSGLEGDPVFIVGLPLPMSVILGPGVPGLPSVAGTTPLPLNSPGLEVAAIAGRP